MSMRYFDRNMTASEVRRRLYELLNNKSVPEKEIAEIKREHKRMCRITIDREMALASQGWMTEE